MIIQFSSPGDVNLRTKTPFGGALRVRGVVRGTISICTMEGLPINPKHGGFHLKHAGNRRSGPMRSGKLWPGGLHAAVELFNPSCRT